MSVHGTYIALEPSLDGKEPPPLRRWFSVRKPKRGERRQFARGSAGNTRPVSDGGRSGPKVATAQPRICARAATTMRVLEPTEGSHHGVDSARPRGAGRFPVRVACLTTTAAARPRPRLPSARRSSRRTRTATSRSICIGILNHLFFWPEQYRRTGGMSIVFLFDENPDVASAGSGGAAVGGARSVPDHAARSNSERAAPSPGARQTWTIPPSLDSHRKHERARRGRAAIGGNRWQQANGF